MFGWFKKSKTKSDQADHDEANIASEAVDTKTKSELHIQDCADELKQKIYMQQERIRTEYDKYKKNEELRKIELKEKREIKLQEKREIMNISLIESFQQIKEVIEKNELLKVEFPVYGIIIKTTEDKRWNIRRWFNIYIRPFPAVPEDERHKWAKKYWVDHYSIFMMGSKTRGTEELLEAGSGYQGWKKFESIDELVKFMKNYCAEFIAKYSKLP